MPYNISTPATATKINATMLPLPAAPDVVYDDGIAVGPETVDCAAMLDGTFDFVLAPVPAADLAVVLPAAYGTVETGMTETVETTVTGADEEAALLDTGDEAAEEAADTGQTVV